MARDKLTEYSATASENTVCGDVNIAENSALPSDMNNFAREVMSHLKNFSDGTDAIDALTVDGNTLVGQSSDPFPGVGNTVQGISLHNSGRIAVSSDGNPAAYFNRKTSDGALIDLRKDGTTFGQVTVKNGDLNIGNGITGLRINDGSDVIHPFSITGNSSTNNLTDLGTSTSTFKDLYLGGGVYLGGTAAANQLDDYEEGDDTSTAVRSDASTVLTSGSSTYLLHSHAYTKIGRFVFATIKLEDRRSSKGTLTVDTHFNIRIADRRMGSIFSESAGIRSSVHGGTSTRVSLEGADQYKYGFYMYEV